jgi:hypothetical protein
MGTIFLPTNGHDHEAMHIHFHVKREVLHYTMQIYRQLSYPSHFQAFSAITYGETRQCGDHIFTYSGLVDRIWLSTSVFKSPQLVVSVL